MPVACRQYRVCRAISKYTSTDTFRSIFVLCVPWFACSATCYHRKTDFLCIFVSTGWLVIGRIMALSCLEAKARAKAVSRLTISRRVGAGWAACLLR